MQFKPLLFLHWRPPSTICLEMCLCNFRLIRNHSFQALWSFASGIATSQPISKVSGLSQLCWCFYILIFQTRISPEVVIFFQPGQRLHFTWTAEIHRSMMLWSETLLNAAVPMYRTLMMCTDVPSIHHLFGHLGSRRQDFEWISNRGTSQAQVGL